MAMPQEEILKIVFTELMEKSLTELREAERNNQHDLFQEVREFCGEVVKS
ncbi:MAG: hypothetical protein ACM3TR_03215 [Caulobacteraceae bacterium]